MKDITTREQLERRILETIPNEWATAEALQVLMGICITGSFLLHTLGELSNNHQIECLEIMNGEKNEVAYFFAYRKLS